MKEENWINGPAGGQKIRFLTQSGIEEYFEDSFENFRREKKSTKVIGKVIYIWDRTKPSANPMDAGKEKEGV